jgi:DNA-binding response OmpR family regulator
MQPRDNGEWQSNAPEPSQSDDAVRILVVDDHRDNVAIISDYLTSRGFQVSTALSGGEALERFDEGRPPIVLLDIMMPDRSGWDVCKSIKERVRHGEQVRVIMVTALDGWNDKRQALRTGADDYLTKPIQLAELMACVERNLALVRGQS